MIEFREVSRRFGHGRRAVEALVDVSLRVPAGGITALVGPNGAGKSTAFALALGFLGPSSGIVTIEGGDPRRFLRTRGAGYLPDRFVLPAGWPVRRALGAFAALERAPADAVEAALERWGLAEVADREAATLSHGMRQRVGLAQATLSPHPLVVLDEPAQGLDPIWRIRLRDRIVALRDAGATVLLASHDTAEVERLADRVIVLHAGRIIDTFERERPAEPGAWRLVLSGSSDHVVGIFPTAERLDDTTWRIEAADDADLAARLAALLAHGARIRALQPHGMALEDRVRRAIEPHG